jgi:capsular exopolysaccharide synthesis family protein
MVPPGYVPAYPVPPGQSNEGEEEGPGLLEYWRLLRRRKGTVFLIAAAGLILAILITLPMTPIYTAKAWIEIQETNQNFLNMKEVQQFSSDSGGYMLMTDIQTHIRVLQSLSLLDRVTAKFKSPSPDGAAKDEPEVGRVSAWRRALNLPEEKPEDERASAVTMAQKSIKVRAQGQTRIIEITTDSTDKKLAAEYVNTLANEFIEQNMESRWQQTQKTGEWLTRQLDEMKIKLEKSEDQLQDYARRSGLLFTNEKSSVSEERLKQLQQALSAATAERVAKQSRFEMAKNASPETLPDVINDSGLRDLQAKLTELNRQTAEMRATYNDKYPKLAKVEPQIQWLQAQFNRERAAILARIQNENTEALRKESLLRVDYETQAKLVRDEGEKGVHYGILKREVDSSRQLYESMLQRVKEASLAGAMKASNIRVVDPARVPRMPSRPSLPMNAALGLLAGLFVGVAFVVTTDKANKTFRDPGDIQFYLNLPELGVIPSEKAQTGSYAKRRLKAAVHNDKLLLGGGASGSGELTERIELTVHQQKSSMLAESFRATLTSILFTGQNGQRPKALVLTSSGPGEGKSTVVSNLAAALGEIHQRVLLIDADTRKPRQHEIYGVPNETGLTTLLLDTRDPVDVDLEHVILPTRVPGVFLMPAGPQVAAVTNLLYSGRMEQYLEILSHLFDVVLIDTPPMLQIPDARVLGRMAGGIVLVVRTGKTTRDAATAVRQRLQEDGTKILGTVLNDWNPKASPGGYYGYTQGYYQSYKGYYGAGQKAG